MASLHMAPRPGGRRRGLRLGVFPQLQPKPDLLLPVTEARAVP